jgi:hypothetical protein
MRGLWSSLFLLYKGGIKKMDDYVADIIIEESASYFSEDLLEHESFASLNSIAQDMQM